jgi:hypothetical protein
MVATFHDYLDYATTLEYSVQIAGDQWRLMSEKVSQLYKADMYWLTSVMVLLQIPPER